MAPSRRDLLTASATALAAGLAGCSALGDTANQTRTGDATTDAATAAASAAAGATSDAAVAAEWNAIRARIWDALALGRAGDAAGGATIAQQTFERFEHATGEYGAHETLEATSEPNYAEFEEALGELRTEGLQAGDLDRAREEAGIASDQLAESQRALVGDATADALALQHLGATAQNAGFLAATGNLEAARTTADAVLARFEQTPAHDALEAADGDAYERFETAVSDAAAAAENGSADAVATHADAAFTAALDGSYALADSDAAAAAGHLAALQARGWDAAALAAMGGPSPGFAHAAVLNTYRARVVDARWLAARGQTDAATAAVERVFAHFEGANAHDALETTDAAAYEAFETGLSDLQTAIENGDLAGVDDAVAAVDDALVAGIAALAGANAPLLEAGFFRARLADARERYRRGAGDAATAIAKSLFRRFEANELAFHETVESTSESLYHRFEEKHLKALVTAFESGDDAAVATHYRGAQTALRDFETAAGTAPTVSGAEATYFAARGFDAAALATLGDAGRARTVARDAFGYFESGAGGYHEALEAADHATYEAFEQRLGAIATAATNDGDVAAAAVAFNDAVVASVYAIVAAAGGDHRDVAADVARGLFARFEASRVHERLEHADRNAYEAFEGALKAYVDALAAGNDVAGAAARFARAAQYAEFAVVDGVEDVPLDLQLAGAGGGHGGRATQSTLSGGPNVVQGVPADADHVVDMQAVSFAPAKLEVSAGDTVAWTHAGGEAHTVTAVAENIPADAAYWASGGFASEQAARAGWKKGKGAVQSGQSYVHTFETPGTHDYVCIPHEAAGMTGTVVVTD